MSTTLSLACWQGKYDMPREDTDIEAAEQADNVVALNNVEEAPAAEEEPAAKEVPRL
jgi:hypothetical protein